ncbi:hypothetical protein RBSWK_01527 [Rhodopirellula baltica SWK14]|uniref:Uncharacterized protein n=1 Tax=Rhodopirellula baltica SWK14 TaxID=993516 RepID=L7CLP0_RHOBT|nr:hypothetical protein RBSWK_01527 [Rhodopirellula baltica SWK14]
MDFLSLQRRMEQFDCQPHRISRSRNPIATLGTYQGPEITKLGRSIPTFLRFPFVPYKVVYTT